MNDLEVDRQVATQAAPLPSLTQLTRWVGAVMSRHPEVAARELTIRLVDEDEGRQLNHAYRGKDKPTNVLSFPFESPPGVDLPLLGDLVICHGVVVDEAERQQKALFDHYAHMVIHGTLHLLGYDHIEDDDAEVMEQMERDILAGLAIADPYTSHSDARQEP